MSLTTAQQVEAAIKEAMGRWPRRCEDTSAIEAEFPRPWFSSEGEAWSALQAMVTYVEQLPEKGRLGAKVLYPMAFENKRQFITLNIAELYLRECPSYKLFWTISLPPFYDEIRAYRQEQEEISAAWLAQNKAQMMQVQQ